MRSVTLAPLSMVPFLLPRSRKAQPSPSRSIARCWRESPVSSGNGRSAALERPSEIRSASRGMNRFWPSGERIWSSFIELGGSLYYAMRAKPLPKIAGKLSQDFGEGVDGFDALVAADVIVGDG